MNDAAVLEIWERLERLEEGVRNLHALIAALEARGRARLKEEVDSRKMLLSEAPEEVKRLFHEDGSLR